MLDQWELICFTQKWMADNMPPIYDTHGIETAIWKEQNQPQYYLPEEHIYYYDNSNNDDIDIYNEHTDDYDTYEEPNITYDDSSESDYDDDNYY